MPRPLRFVADEMLGRLAKWLRLLGQDVLYPRSAPDSYLLRLCLQEPDRLLLTRDTRLIQTRPVRQGSIKALLVDSDGLEEQLEQVVRETGLKPGEPRCSVDNERLVPLRKEEAESRVPEYVYQTQERFERCPRCGRIYWPATHWQGISRVRNELFCEESD